MAREVDRKWHVITKRTHKDYSLGTPNDLKLKVS